MYVIFFETLYYLVRKKKKQNKQMLFFFALMKMKCQVGMIKVSVGIKLRARTDRQICGWERREECGWSTCIVRQRKEVCKDNNR